MEIIIMAGKLIRIGKITAQKIAKPNIIHLMAIANGVSSLNRVDIIGKLKVTNEA